MAYGFEIRDSSNNVTVDSSDSQLYVISRHYVPYKSTSYITEPNFDINEGEWVIKQHMTPAYATGDYFGIPTGFAAFDSYSDQASTTARNYGSSIGTYPNLQFSWNNTTKVFSWTAPAMYFGDTWIGFDFNPGGSGAWFHDQGNFEVVFMRYI